MTLSEHIRRCRELILLHPEAAEAEVIVASEGEARAYLGHEETADDPLLIYDKESKEVIL